MARQGKVNKSDDYQRSIRHLESYGASIRVLIKSLMKSSAIDCHSVDFRVKEMSSADRKVSSNPEKYTGFAALTDLLGVRIITHFNDDVDEVARLLEAEFEVDEENSVDKRLSLEPDRFGYLSLHYILGLNSSRSSLVEYRDYQGLKFEVQIRSILQHAWAEIEHDLGYKAKSVLPKQIRRRFSRVAGLLEVADDEFRSLRDDLLRYRESVELRVADTLAGVPIDSATIEAYMDQMAGLIGEIDSKITSTLSGQWKAEFKHSAIASLLARGFAELGFRDLANVHSEFESAREQIVEFASAYLDRFRKAGHMGGHLTVGISLVYLFYLKLGVLPVGEIERIVGASFAEEPVDVDATAQNIKNAWEKLPR